MSINELPYEVLHKIFKCIANDDDDFQDPAWSLASISRTSRHLHYPAKSVLYSSFEEYNRRTLLKYLGTILACPRYAANVKQYKGRHKPWTSTKYSASLYFSVRNTHKFFMEKIVREIASNEQEAQDWFHAIVEGSWDATTALTLAQLPYLQHLHLAILGDHNPANLYQADRSYYWIRETLMRAAQVQYQGISNPLTLEHLSTITLVPSRESSRELSMAQLLPLLKMKSLRKLVARGWDLHWRRAVEKFATSIVELEILNFGLEATYFIAFFEYFPALERLHYEHAALEDCVPHQLTVMSLAHTLIQLDPPLKELCIENGSGCDRQDDHSFVNIIGMSVIQSFSRFENLEIVDMLAYDKWIHPVGFIDVWKCTLAPLVDLLPSSITRLSLRGASSLTIEHAMGLLQQRDRVPRLEVLTIDFTWSFPLDEVIEDLGLLKDLGSRRGIEISIQGGLSIGPVVDLAEVDTDLYSQ